MPFRTIVWQEDSPFKESGDDWTLARINKGYQAEDILGQCHKLEEANLGEFTPLSEKEMLVELKAFVEHLTCDCAFITHHTVSGKNLTGPDFLKRKDSIITALEQEIRHGNLDFMAEVRRHKNTL